MRASTFFTILLLVGGLFSLFTLMVQEANQQYPDANLDSTEWNNKYDYASRINKTVAPLKNAFDKIADEKNGWFQKITAGIAAIPYAIIIVPSVIFNGLNIGSEMIAGFSSAISIPGSIVLICIIGLIIWGIFKLVEFFQPGSKV